MSVFPSRSPMPGTDSRWARLTGPGGRMVRRLLEGKHRWGELEVWSSRYGCTAYSLIVYPPGATAAERIRFRALRSWPPVGLLLAFFTTLATGRTLPVAAAVGFSAAVYVAGALVLARIAGPSRRHVRTLQTWRRNEWAGEADRGPQDLLEQLVVLLLDAERRLRAGTIDPARFEAEWAIAWRALGRTDEHGRHGR